MNCNLCLKCKSLCHYRTLSSEKKAFYNKLIELNIVIPAIEMSAVENDLPSAIVEVPDKGTDKLEEMVKSQNELKKNLSQLQSQLTELATADNEALPSRRNKARKSKKNVTIAEPVE